MEGGAPTQRLKLLASTTAVTDTQQIDDRIGCEGDSDANRYFKRAEWTADGTSIITHSAGNFIRTFVMYLFHSLSRYLLIQLKDRPPDLLEDRQQELQLEHYYQTKTAEAIRALITYPYFDLQDPSTALLLCSLPDHPLRLQSALSGELVASYPLACATTEAFISPHCLTFAGDGRAFIGGSKNLLAIFNASRPGEGPFRVWRTAPSSRARPYSSSMAMKGIVSALSIEPATDLLAAGTFSRHVGLYDIARGAECAGVFRVDGTEADTSIGGKGVTQLEWSPCGRYLYIIERDSCGVMVYDIRRTGQLLSWAEGRNAKTSQRLGVDLSASSQADGGLELWAGGVDGIIRTWQNTHLREGSQQPDAEWAAHDDAISSTIVHPSGSVIASCSGQRHLEVDEYDSSETSMEMESAPSMDRESAPSMEMQSVPDNSLKLWCV